MTRGDATLTVGHRKLEAPLEPEWRSTCVRMSKGCQKSALYSLEERIRGARNVSVYEDV